MRTPLVILYALLLSLISCQNNEFEQSNLEKASPEFYLEFKVDEPLYGQSLDSLDPGDLVFHCPQDFNLNSTITSARGIPNFSTSWLLEESKDSVWLDCNLSFTLENLAPVPIPIEIFLCYKESRDKVEATSDSTYIYRDKRDLVELLKTTDWTDFDWNKFNSLMQFNIPLSDPTVKEFSEKVFPTYSNAINNYMFYHDWENFSFTKVHYSEVYDKIYVQGNFDVSLKMLSCGWWEIIHIKEAHFQARLD